MSKQYYIYILTNLKNNVFYIGSTSDLQKRIYEHKNKIFKGFSKKYNVEKLVYYEIYDDPYLMVSRERQLKNWHRDWKINLIKSKNPDFNDLYDSLF
ncbi:MAG: GIY-YIG nuclease family protein [bacterium]|nr:GIY-YIG nuclease family protein [bacterium]